MTPTIKIGELADFVHKASNAWKVMALLRVYFDESGTHDDSRIVALGGLMGSKRAWEGLEEKWADAIDTLADAGVTWFHSVDWHHGTGECEGVQPEIRFAVTNRLARITAGFPLLPVWAAVVKEDWDRTVKDREFLQEFPKPLHLCFRCCAMRLAEGSAQLAEGSSVAVVYAEQPEYQDDFSDQWNAYRRNKQRAKLSSFTTARPRDLIPLQAADMVAYEMNKDWGGHEYGEPPPPLTYNIRKPLYYLREGGLRMTFGGCYDARALEVAIKRFKETGEI